jgi:hypothetical protein
MLPAIPVGEVFLQVGNGSLYHHGVLAPKEWIPEYNEAQPPPGAKVVTVRAGKETVVLVDVGAGRKTSGSVGVP